jgi:hypothetical protein
MCQIDVREKNVVHCLKALFSTLEVYKSKLFPAKTIFAARERERFNLKNNLPYTRDYLVQYMHQIDEVQPVVHSRAERVRIANAVTPANLGQVFNKLYNVEKCLLVYQGKTDLKLEWGDFL